MLTRSHQISPVADEERDRLVLRDQRGSGKGANAEGTCVVAPQEVIMEYDRVTDVMHVDLYPTPEGAARVDVIDVGEQVGFPGQIVARVDLERRIFYGLTIQNFSSFKRRLFWMYKMASIQRALQLMINLLRAGLWMDRNHPAHLHA